MGQQRDSNSPDVVIGEDWEKDVELSNELKDSRLRRGLWAFRKSPLTRKIVTFNLIALNILIIGVLFLNSLRDNHVLVIVEDTGPEILKGALGKVFNRFYSERPANDFGNNSGLGLAISKQIVEAHDGAIWAENIRPTQMDATSAPLGARFVVGLPL